MAKRLRRIRQALAAWWECRSRRCSYFTHYQVYGPCELSHIGWHNAEKRGEEHFRDCSYRGDGLCPSCLRWEERLRA